MTAESHVPEETIKSVLASYGRSCNQPVFFEEFYDAFMESSEEVPAMFTATDMDIQRGLLRNGISAVIQYAKNEALSTEVVEELAGRHDKNNLAIPPHLYAFWLESLIATLKKFDPQYSPELEGYWRQVIKITVDKFTGAYE